ncbi:MAG: hypothetical protein GXO93_07820 [FCB group bacterium]|nr:hypothetical protein [FCB group bacterium]
MEAKSNDSHFLAMEMFEDYLPLAKAFIATADNSEDCAYINAATCPDCGGGMVCLGGCFSCPSCGFSVCGG